MQQEVAAATRSTDSPIPAQHYEMQKVSKCRTFVTLYNRYTLDLRSELSAFDGQLLADQADFAIACLAQLKAMYSAHGITARSSTIDVSELPPNLMPRFEEPNVGASNIGASNSDGSSSGSSNDSKSSSSNREVSGNPAGIILVGHSMGGVVARAAAAAAWKHPDLGECVGCVYDLNALLISSIVSRSGLR